MPCHIFPGAQCTRLLCQAARHFQSLTRSAECLLKMSCFERYAFYRKALKAGILNFSRALVKSMIQLQVPAHIIVICTLKVFSGCCQGRALPLLLNHPSRSGSEVLAEDEPSNRSWFWFTAWLLVCVCVCVCVFFFFFSVRGFYVTPNWYTLFCDQGISVVSLYCDTPRTGCSGWVFWKFLQSC